MESHVPEVEYVTTVDAPLDQIWDYVQDMTKWGHLLVGFQGVEIVDERQSIWTLKGDVGILTREVRLQVDITDWLPNERVTFVLTGITERLDGAGTFIMAAVGEETVDASGPAPAVEAPPRVGPFKRLQLAMARAMLRRIRRRSAQPEASVTPTRVGQAATESAGGPTSRLTFLLRVSPLGPMAPMLELLMGPMIEPAAQELADGIRAAVEAR
jgi:carbon monoxide dehydrogenase subunit G